MSTDTLHAPSSETDRAASAPASTSGASAPATTGRGVQLMRSLASNGYEVQRRALAPVQLRGGEDTGSVHEAAASGIASGGGALPHADKIQAAFGGHDVSGIQAHTGSAAVQASKAMGAEAYATGNHVAFGGAPDLHTVAHEAAHVVQQQAGVSLSGGVGQAGDRYEQHADQVADAVVQGKSAEPILDKMAGGPPVQKQSVQRRSIQRYAVQRDETPTPNTNTTNTNTTNTNTTNTNTNQTNTNQTSTETTGPNTNETPVENAPPAFTGPRTFEAYVGHIQATFAAQLGELKTMADTLKANGGDAKRQNQQLVGDAEKLAALKKDYALTKDTLDKDQKRKAEGAISAAQGAVDNAGLAMPQMLEKAKALVAQIQQGGGDSVKLKKDLELTMQGAMALAAQIDPDGTGKGRALYNTIDKSENPKLIGLAAAAQLPMAEQAQLAVDYRNWLRQFFRDTVMVDQTNAEIFYLRDLGIVGQRAGLSLDQVMAKVVRDMQKVDEGTGQALLRGDFTMGTATPQELDGIYAGVIGSAKKTNAGANTSATGNADGKG